MDDDAETDGWTTGRAVGIVGGTAGLAASLFVLFGPVVQTTTARSDGTTTAGSMSGIDWLLGVPEAQFALFAWPVAMGVVSLVGVAAAWRGGQSWLWGAGLTLLAFSVVAGFSIGLLYGPAAVLLLAAAVLERA